MAGDPASDDPAPAPPAAPAPSATPRPDPATAPDLAPSQSATPRPDPVPAPSATPRPDPAPAPSATPRPDPANVEPAARRRIASAPVARPRRPARLVPLGGWRSRRRAVLLALAFLAPCAVIAVSVVSIVKDTARPSASAPTESAVVAPLPAPSAAPVAPAPPTASAASANPSPLPSAVTPLDVGDAGASDFYEATDDGEPSEPKNTPPKPPKRYASVQQAAAESCSTASVDKLSRQIIEQARCMKPNAFVLLPARPNLVVAPNVFPYLELGARNQLLRVLDANPSRRMTLNSALRTVAQQYLVSRWAAGKRCGVPLATKPGESNHEIGTALDVAEPAQWRKELEAHDFHWLGAADRVHFDYKGSTAPASSTTDVLAFQILWNRNHPTDTLPTDGRYSSATEQRLRKAPAEGFPLGPRCGKAKPR